MILTVKSKDDFEKWVRKDINRLIIPLQSMYYPQNEILLNALIIEWFDSVGIYIIIKKTIDVYWIFDIQYNMSSVRISALDPMQESRLEATKQAIIKANEIYNSSKN